MACARRDPYPSALAAGLPAEAAPAARQAVHPPAPGSASRTRHGAPAGVCAEALDLAVGDLEDVDRERVAVRGCGLELDRDSVAPHQRRFMTAPGDATLDQRAQHF